MNLSADRQCLHPGVPGQPGLVQGPGDLPTELWVQGTGPWMVYLGEGVVDGQVLVLSNSFRAIDAV